MASQRVVSLFPAADRTSSVRVVTYNVHSCVGVDRRADPSRVAAVLREIDADIACLQEVDSRPRGDRRLDQGAYLAEAVECQIVAATGIRDHRRRIRNAILTRLPVLSSRTIDLSVAGHEPRGAIDIDVSVGVRVLRVIATHFGLNAGERRLQSNRLIAALGEPEPFDRPIPDAVLVMGDLNEWRGRSGGLGALDRRLGPCVAARTFPSWMPVLPLDRIYIEGAAFLREVRVYRSPLARLASDHLPLVGQLALTRWAQMNPAEERADWRSRTGTEGAARAG